MNESKPLTTLVSQGWEIAGYLAGMDNRSGVHGYSVLLRRQKQHKILMVRNKWIGKGLVATEVDL